MVYSSIEEDINRSKHNLDYANHLLEEKFTKVLSILKNDKEYSREYKYFVENMSYAEVGSTPSFEEAIQALEELTDLIIKNTIK